MQGGESRDLGQASALNSRSLLVPTDHKEDPEKPSSRYTEGGLNTHLSNVSATCDYIRDLHTLPPHHLHRKMVFLDLPS